MILNKWKKFTKKCIPKCLLNAQVSVLNQNTLLQNVMINNLLYTWNSKLSKNCVCVCVCVNFNLIIRHLYAFCLNCLFILTMLKILHEWNALILLKVCLACKYNSLLTLPTLKNPYIVYIQSSVPLHLQFINWGYNQLWIIQYCSIYYWKYKWTWEVQTNVVHSMNFPLNPQTPW